MNVISEIQRINQLELSKGLTHTSASWHTKYANSAWINVGSLPLHLTEGDIICIFSQYGEIDDIHLVRDTDTGKSRGFAFVKYEDARSCVLAVDNLCGCVVLGRTLRVDHVERYRLPKHVQEKEEQSGDNDTTNNNNNVEAGHAYKGQELASEYDIHAGQDLFAAPKNQKGDDDLDKNHQNRGGEEEVKEDSKAERRRRKEERAQKRKEKEEHRRRKEERKRRKHRGRSGKEKRRRSRSRSYSSDE